MVSNVKVLVIIYLISLNILQVYSVTVTTNRKLLETMVMRMLWERVYHGLDSSVKQKTIEALKKKGQFNSLVEQLQSVKKERLNYVMNLVAELMIAFSR